MSAWRPELDSDLAAALAVLREAFDPGQIEVVSVQRRPPRAGQPPAAPAREGEQASLLEPEGRA
jgi:hypothetical protein